MTLTKASSAGSSNKRIILIDLNVILDVLLERDGHQVSRSVLELGEVDRAIKRSLPGRQRRYRLYVSAHSVTTFAYLLENARVPKPQILLQIGWLLQTFVVVPVDNGLLAEALQSRITDYEDAVIERAAVACGAVAIITRNGRDFGDSAVVAMAPEEFLASLV